MRSARTAPPPPPPTPSRSAAAGPTDAPGRRQAGHRWTRLPASPGTGRCAATALLAVLLLGGCSTGGAEDARRGAAADADAATPVLADLQATRISQRFNPATPGATPGITPTAIPPATSLEALVIALDLGPGNAPREQYAAVPANATTVYADALLHNLRAGQTVTTEWIDVNGNQVAASESAVAADAAQGWVALPLRLAGSLAPGDYAAFVGIDGRPLDSIVFRVLPPGSGAQALGPLPANPEMTEGGFQMGPGPVGTGQPIQPVDGIDTIQPVDDAYVEPIDGGNPAPIDGVADPVDAPIIYVTETP